MASIRKPAKKTRSRGSILFFCVIIAINSFGILQVFLMWNQDYFSQTPGGLHHSPLVSMNSGNEKETSRSSNVKKEEIKLPKLSFPKSNEYKFHNPYVDQKKKVYIFHHTLSLPDGSEGAVILDMLQGHAYAYHQGGIYGGSCGEGNDVGRVPENSLIKTIGLQDFLQFACPRDIETKDRKKVVPKRSYTEDGTRVFTPEYVDLLRSVISYPNRSENKKKENTIVVHIARGKKFTPCRKKPHRNYEPYLPNKHYQLLINKYMKDGFENKVIIYSQSKSYEKFDEFREKGYELHIDEKITDIWKTVLTSDVFIMSRSAFSFVPAMVASADTKVIYTPFWHKGLKNWETVRKDILSQSDAEFERLKSTCK